jgi:two-component system, NarL family, response regulator DesR
MDNRDEPDELSVGVGGSKPKLLRVAVEALEADGLDVRAATGNPRELGAELHGLHVDAVVCIVPDLAQQVRCVTDLHQQLPGAHIVLVGPASSRLRLRRLLDAGLEAFVLDTKVRDLLPVAVRAACKGQVSVPVELARSMERQPLTFRQKQVLRLVVLGRTNAEIANELYLSESTVKGHLSAALAKLGARSRHEAAALIQDPETGLGLGVMDANGNGNGLLRRGDA